MNNKTIKDITESNINLDSIEFKKISKRLQENIQREIKAELMEKYKDEIFNSLNITFKLSQVDNMLAKSLGFQNYKAVNTYFSKNKITYETVKKGRVLDMLEADDIISLFLFLIPEENKLKSTAMIFMSTLIKALVYLRDQQEILLDAQIIISYLNIEHLWKLYRTRRDFPNEIRAEINYYYSRIPNFEKNALLISNNEFHTKIEVLLYPFIKLIDNIEKFDPIVISPSWYQENYTTYNIENKATTSVSHTHLINEFKLNSFYNKFSNNDWKQLFEKKIPIIYENKIDQKISFDGFSPMNIISDNLNFENSWLADEKFQQVLNNLIINKQFKTYYLSELLFYSMKIINTDKRKLYKDVIMNLLNNSNLVTEYSLIFNNLTSVNKSKIIK